MDNKKLKVDQDLNQNPSLVKSEKTFKVLRKSIERLGFDEVLDTLTQLSLDDPSVFDVIRDKFNRKKELRKIFVRSIAYGTTEESFNQAMENFGQVEECLLIRDQETKKPKGFGFVVFKDYTGAVRALEEGTVEVSGRTAHIHFAVYNYRDENNRPIGRDPPQGPEKRHENQIFIRNLGNAINEDMLREVFEKYGPIEECSVPKDRESGRQRGYGFIKYFSNDSAERCLEQPDKDINGVIVKCDYSSKRKRPDNIPHHPYDQNRPMPNSYNRGYNPMQMQPNDYFAPPPMHHPAEPLPDLHHSVSNEELQRQLQELQLAQAKLVQKIGSDSKHGDPPRGFAANMPAAGGRPQQHFPLEDARRYYGSPRGNAVRDEKLGELPQQSRYYGANGQNASNGFREKS